ncbi:MAG: serine hydrolase domain-containing protein [Planctomycetaceae bacterium]
MRPADDYHSLGLDQRRWQAALDLARGWCERGDIPALGLVVGRGGKTTGVHLFGRQRLDAESPPIRDDAIFLIASITKPIVAAGVMLLVERGLLSLSDRVRDFVPEFGGKGRYGITIHHLLTHTSGLPDMVPNDRELRSAHAPFAAFVESICQVNPDFPAGRGVQYQSMGFGMLAEVISHVTGKPYAAFLDEELFSPLAMRDTALGVPDKWFEGPNPIVGRIAEIRLPKQHAGTEEWSWNSRYWRSFGSPWGGLLTTPADLARFAQMLLNQGRVERTQLLAPATIEASTRNQLAHMPNISEEDRRCRPWGLGWRLHWPAYSANFGNLLGPRMFGHWGSTGTVLWIDPDRDAFAVVLTTQPQEPLGTYLARLSNAIVAAMV